MAYVEIASEKADCKYTLLGALGRIQAAFMNGINQKWVIVVGDGKTYELLQCIRSEYGSNLKWLLPYPGDWHILLNYQKALMKIYSDAGLLQLANSAGYRGETLTSLVKCSNFRRTHAFLLQSFEAFYRFFLSLYLGASDSTTVDTAESYENDISTLILQLLTEFASISKEEDVASFQGTCDAIFNGELSSSYEQFVSFMENLSNQQDTIQFWFNFVQTDCLVYFGLFAALRRRCWDTRNVCIKLMAPLFTALDCPVYGKLIPQHLNDLLALPEVVLRHLKDGAFSVCLTPSKWHATALDECHEMCINKDAKLAVIRPSKEKMTHLSNYLSFRSAAIKNLEIQLFPERQTKQTTLPTKITSRDAAMSECGSYVEVY